MAGKGMKEENKYHGSKESTFFDRRKRYVCAEANGPLSRTENGGILNDGASSSNCFSKMSHSLQILKHEMVHLAYLNVQLMEKMIEMQNQIEVIKQDRMDLLLEEYKSELFNKKVDNLSLRTQSCATGPSLLSANENQRDFSSRDSEFTSAAIEKINPRPGRRLTIDSLSSLPSVSSIQSECSYVTTETETEEEFGTNENETASSDSGIDIRQEYFDIDYILTAATSTV